MAPLLPLLPQLLRAGLDLVLPLTCPGCGAPEPWCPGCASTVGGRPREPLLPDATLDRWPGSLPAVRALARYADPVRSAIIAGKERGRRDLPPRLGRALGAGLLRMRDTALLAGELWLVPAPTRASAARRRGGDPVLVMARAAAAVVAEAGTSCAVAPCLVTGRRARDSVGLGAAARMANLSGRVRFDPRGAPPPGTAVVLVDDVLTTGATACAATGVLRAAALDVAAVVTLAAVPAWRTTR